MTRTPACSRSCPAPGRRLSFTADKSGGFAQPNITLSALSARKGLVSGAADDAASGVISPTAYFGAADAKLFGTIDLGDLIDLVAGGSPTPRTNAPEIRTHAVPNRHHPTELDTVINWTPQLASRLAARLPGSASRSTPRRPSTLQVKIAQKLDGTPPASKAHGQLTNFQLTMSGVIGLNIDKITFDSSNGAKSTVALDLAKQHAIQFEGALAVHPDARRHPAARPVRRLGAVDQAHADRSSKSATPSASRRSPAACSR